MPVKDLPILDARNIVVYRCHSIKGCIDPVGRLALAEGRPSDLPSDWNQEEFSLQFFPALTPKILADAEAGQDWDGFESATSKFAKLVTAFVEFRREGDLDFGIARLDKFYGIGLPDRPVYTGGFIHSELDPGFEFWPVGVPGRNVALARYFLGFLQFEVLLRHQTIGYSVSRPPPSECGVVIDRALADFVGLDSFPLREERPDGLILISKREMLQWPHRQR